MRSGDKAVYPGRGVCAVVEVDANFIKLRDPDGLILVPVDKVPQLLRPVATVAEVQQVFDVLRESGDLPVKVSWPARRRSYKEKLKSGLFEVAEVFRDLCQKQKHTRLPDTEQGFRIQALQMLCREIAVARGQEEAAAAKEICRAVGQ